MYFYQIMKNRLSGLFFLMLTVCANAQVTFPYNGVMPKDVTSVAFLHATIIVDFQTRIDDATLLIERGKVVSVGKNLALPDNVVRVDLKGKFIYPSFIDLYSDCGIASQMPTTEMKRGEHKIPEAVAEKGAFGWNPAIHPEVNAADLFSMKQEVLDEYRKLGFGAVLTHMQDGIVRGSAAFV
jgi:cytosine/adenosine deaminase-related metal-dependent hydrolase